MFPIYSLNREVPLKAHSHIHQLHTYSLANKNPLFTSDSLSSLLSPTFQSHFAQPLLLKHHFTIKRSVQKENAMADRYILQKAVSIFKAGTSKNFLAGEDKGIYELTHYVPKSQYGLIEIKNAWKNFLKTPIGQNGVELHALDFTQSSFLAFREAIKETSHDYSAQPYPFSLLHIDNLSIPKTIEEIRKLKIFKSSPSTLNKQKLAHSFTIILEIERELSQDPATLKWELNKLQSTAEWSYQNIKMFNVYPHNISLYLRGTETAVKMLAAFITRFPESQKKLADYWTTVLYHPSAKVFLLLEDIRFSQCSFRAFCQALQNVSTMGDITIKECKVDKLSSSQFSHFIADSLKNCYFKTLNIINET